MRLLPLLLLSLGEFCAPGLSRGPAAVGREELFRPVLGDLALRPLPELPDEFHELQNHENEKKKNKRKEEKKKGGDKNAENKKKIGKREGHRNYTSMYLYINK